MKMSAAALATIGLTWIIITGFTGYFFWRVLKTPQEKE